MPLTIKMSLTPESVDEAIRQLEEYAAWLKEKASRICEKLAWLGYDVAFDIMLDHIYSGETINSLDVKAISDTKYEIVAESTALMFLEFGAGLPGVGHPTGLYGTGTYPGQTHATDPQGWWFPTDDPNLIVYTSPKTGISYGHSHGNPPAMPMYTATVEIRNNIEQIAREVFAE